VYVQGIIHDGQAESMGIFEVGDRLQGVGELPLAEGGFQRAINMVGGIFMLFLVSLTTV
jgi:hypothetical protein